MVRLKGISVISISSKHIQLLMEKSRKSDQEIGALLFGVVRGEEALVRSVKLMRYSSRSRTYFQADPTFLFESFSEADRLGFDLVGIFHSHPAPPFPSSIDLKYMELNPVVWIIADSRSFELKAYLLEKGYLREIKIRIK